MFSFYGDISCAIPCIICDAGMRVIFANRTAYGDPVTVKWISLGRLDIEAQLLHKLEEAFSSDPYSIARVDLHSKDIHCGLLADKHTVSGATVYVFALVRGADNEDSTLPAELDGRRMITACFTPVNTKLQTNLPFEAGLAEYFSHYAEKGAEKAGKRIAVTSDVSAVGSAVSNCEAMLACASMVLAAYCKSADGDISVSIKEDRTGVSFAFSAKMQIPVTGSLASCRDASLLCACFGSSAVPMLIALQTAADSGISITAETSREGELFVFVHSDRFDIGDCGFKVPHDLIGNAKTVIYAVFEMLI